MDFQLSEEQRAIADMAGGLFNALCTDERLRAFDQDDEPHMADIWSKCVETGLHALAVPETAGGSALGMTELMVVLEAQGRALAQVPLWRHQLAAWALANFGGAAHEALVRAAVRAESLLTLSLEGLDRSQGVQLSAQTRNQGFVLDGRVGAVALGAQADCALVLARLPQGLRLVRVALDGPGIERVPGRLTHGEAVADLLFDSVPIDDTDVLPENVIAWLEWRAIAALASLQLGVSHEQLRRTVEYVSERQQFDRPIGSFQAVQMTLADACIAIEAMRSVLWQLVYRLDAGLAAPAEALAVRYLACETGHVVGHKAQHLHGGVGVDLSHPMHRYLYWSRVLGLALGGSAATLSRLGQWLADNDRLGWKYDLEEHQTLC